MWHELPLVIFTICAQMSVGSFIVLGIIHLAGLKVPQKTMDKVTDPALYAIGPLLVLGLAASTMHLGKPLRAPNALLHLGSSWLSREIVAGMAFAALGAAFAVCQWFKLLNHRLRQVLAGLTALVGVFLVFAISKVYSLRTVPAWATLHTPIAFYITTLLLGGLAVAAALLVVYRIRRGRSEPDPAADALLTQTVRAISLGGVVLIAVRFFERVSYYAFLGGHSSPAARRSLEILGGELGGWRTAQALLLAAALLCLAYLLFKLVARVDSYQFLPALGVVAFALAFVGEFIGRLMFYGSMVRVGT
ncbi:dimethyl sulfoxide reductase anchor subunit family protein [Luteococcus sp. Sow4_B9]|uniref:dimethyl sulfoxide reductase anchor subunit family protein n=1 Tax=Luteococcus sp. Sow4_B9 TaxID=3438792 RepID=UPI003F9D993B